MARKQDPLTIAISTGETSGDQIGAELISSLHQRAPHAQFYAVGGPDIRTFSFVETIFDQENLEVMGTDVVFALPRLIRYFLKLRSFLLEKHPDVIVCIDYPGWHLRLARSLRKHGYQGKIIQYVCPTIWAYKKSRLQFMEKYFDEVLCIFPFETACFKGSSLKATYVGNPCIQRLELAEKRKNLLGIFPGSRLSEIKKNLPLQLAAAKKIVRKKPKLKLAISYSSPESKQAIDEIISLTKIKASLFPKLSKASQLQGALATSGTVNLELALHRVPTVVSYQINRLQYLFVRYWLQLKMKFFCMVNIIMKKMLFPEFYGYDLTPDKISKEMISLLDNPINFDQLEKKLGTKKASETAALRILKQVQ